QRSVDQLGQDAAAIQTSAPEALHARLRLCCLLWRDIKAISRRRSASTQESFPQIVCVSSNQQQVIANPRSSYPSTQALASVQPQYLQTPRRGLDFFWDGWAGI